MKIPRRYGSPKSAFTLLEMTIVIMMLLALVSTGMVIGGRMSEWKLGRTASETLREVYSAQRMYLADHPTVDVANITPALLLPYLRTAGTSLPTVKSLEGNELTILVNVSPPVINAGSGDIYDPSDGNRDSLWDVGE